MFQIYTLAHALGESITDFEQKTNTKVLTSDQLQNLFGDDDG